ncbi:kinase-like protein [Rhizophagus irregularis]|uniref:Kinase-like protein n=1 Tax=Rhizophagus irregularis TaxID=588596 RepID=A0A2N0QYK4_9GLOM|nr:kinase-like protein [Rhizophagus irregularis]
MALNNDKVSGNIEFEGSSTKEFEKSGSEEFKGSDSEEFEESSIKESEDGKNVEYLDKGGFGTIYKAIWFYDYKDNEVILKCYNNLSENLNEFLNEWKYHGSCLDSYDIIYFYGFTKNPDTLKYMAVMDYANNGNLRGNLTRIIKSNWNEKLYLLYEIISGLNDIHDQGLIHCDFHDGNILNHNESKIYISDLGLCKPVKSFLKKYDIYGVIPFMAPEVLRGKSYTPASDIYSFSMIIKELNEILESRGLQVYYSSQSIGEKVNEILESEDSQASVKVNKMLSSKDLDDCIFNLKSLDIKTDKNN